MAPLSNELSGVVIPHINFGNHLDNSGKTIDFELEKKNFSFAGNLLAEIWKNVVIDTYPVTAEYVPPSENISES